MNVLRRGHDPFWDLEGQGAKKSRRYQRVVSDLAFALAVVACGLTAAAWLRELMPLVSRVALG